METIANWWKHRDYGENASSSSPSENMTPEAETEASIHTHHFPPESDPAPVDPLLTLKP